MMLSSRDSAPTQVDDIPGVIDIKVWFFTRQYPNISPNALFIAMAKSLQDTPFFKVWKVDNDKKYINLTTLSIRLNPKLNYHQVEADVNVLEGKDPLSSIVNIRITPTLIGVISRYEVFTNVPVNKKFAKYAADLIFGAVEEGYRGF